MFGLICSITELVAVVFMVLAKKFKVQTVYAMLVMTTFTPMSRYFFTV